MNRVTLVTELRRFLSSDMVERKVLSQTFRPPFKRRGTGTRTGSRATLEDQTIRSLLRGEFDLDGTVMGTYRVGCCWLFFSKEL